VDRSCKWADALSQRRGYNDSEGETNFTTKKIFTVGYAQFVTAFRNRNEIASSNFEEQVEEICLAEFGGPGLGSVRQSLFCAD
jgi:hypothetical protein